VIAPRIGMDGRRLAREVALLGGVPLDPEAVEALDEAAGRIFSRLNVAPRPLPGAETLLDELERLDLPWAIATSSRPEQVARSLADLMHGRVPTVVDASSVTAAKPAPDLLLAAARRLGTAPDGCWAVGDSVWDIEAAHAAGMVSVAVTAGSVTSSAALAEAQPSVTVDTLADLARLLVELVAN
jgi:HAD superfamily hydrolase (TIGR01509 family)